MNDVYVLVVLRMLLPGRRINAALHPGLTINVDTWPKNKCCLRPGESKNAAYVLAVP